MTLVRYYGHVGYPSGYGDAANELCMAILAAGYELEIQTNGTQLPARYLPLASCVRATQDLRPPDVVVVHTLPLDCASLLAAEHIRELYPHAQCICYTTWEGTAGSASLAFLEAVDRFDMIWVPSQHNLSSLIACVAATVAIVPHSFDDAGWREHWQTTLDLRNAQLAARPDDGELGRFWFYYIGAWTVRKNVPGLIRAFISEFTDADNVGLHIHSAGASRRDYQTAVLACGVPDEHHAPVVLTTDRLTSDAIIHVERDCFVTASRGEAWNLPAFHALMHARMVIAPWAQGSDDFLADTSAYFYGSYPSPAHGDVVLIQREDAPPGYGVAQLQIGQGMTARDTWQEPDLYQLARTMRAAYANRANRATLDVRYDIAERFGRRAVAKRIKQLIESEGENA